MPRRLAALEPAWDGTPALVPEFMTDLGGGPVTIRCRYGTIQPDKKTAIYYKGNSILRLGNPVQWPLH